MGQASGTPQLKVRCCNTCNNQFVSRIEKSVRPPYAGGEHCWAMGHESDAGKAGMATHCYEPPVWRGRWQDNSGRWWPRIESCGEHAYGLLDVRRITQP